MQALESEVCSLEVSVVRVFGNLNTVMWVCESVLSGRGNCLNKNVFLGVQGFGYNMFRWMLGTWHSLVVRDHHILWSVPCFYTHTHTIWSYIECFFNHTNLYFSFLFFMLLDRGPMSRCHKWMKTQGRHAHLRGSGPPHVRHIAMLK